MERLQERFELAKKAMTKLMELTEKDNLSEIERDALIQRFEFSYELLWKCGKDYLRVNEGIDAASPRKVIRDCRAIGLLADDDVKVLLNMVEDRNITVHAYDEEFAIELSKRIPEYIGVMNKWLEKIK